MVMAAAGAAGAIGATGVGTRLRGATVGAVTPPGVGTNDGKDDAAAGGGRSAARGGSSPPLPLCGAATGATTATGTSGDGLDERNPPSADPSTNHDP